MFYSTQVISHKTGGFLDWKRVDWSIQPVKHWALEKIDAKVKYLKHSKWTNNFAIYPSLQDDEEERHLVC